MKNTQIHDSFFDVYQIDFKIASFRYCLKFKSTIVCGLFLKIWVGLVRTKDSFVFYYMCMDKIPAFITCEN